MDFRSALTLAVIGALAYLALRLVYDAPLWGAVAGSWAAVSFCTSAMVMGYQRDVVRTVCKALAPPSTEGDPS